MELLLVFMLRILPGVLLFAALLLLLPRKNLQYRISAYILLFILVRDTMTPLGIWSFGSEGLFWIRFNGNGVVLVVIAVSSLIMVSFIFYYENELRKLFVWTKTNRYKTLLAGLFGSVMIVLPFVTPYLKTPVEIRGGTVALGLLIPIFFISVLGNLYEEVLFRGYFQGYLEKIVDPDRAFLASGVMFAIGHVYLAITVTNIGLPILLFTLYEGLTLAFIRMKVGVAGAIISHGLAIFILSSGLL